jgi:ATP-binding cassette subfamily F protein uup
MDKVVDHIFEYKGDGVIKDFPGNYTQLRDKEDEKEENVQATGKAKEKGKTKTDKESKKIRKSGLSFNEKRELESLSAEIENLEKEKKQIEEELAGGAMGHNELLGKSLRHGDIIKTLDRIEMRWLELSEKNS